MAFDNIRSAGLIAGRVVKLQFNNLPGQPVVHVEHLGETNAAWLNDEIARANSTSALVTSSRSALSKQKIGEARLKRRTVFAKHAARKLEAKHSNGADATDDDIPEFIAALPDEVFDAAWTFACDAENFRERVIDIGEESVKALVAK
jgi:hypothetical protein